MKYLICFCITILTLGCSNKKSVMERIDDQFKQSLKLLTNTDQVTADIYMVIPRAGCSSCISDAESYMIKCLEDSVNHRYIKFILTDFDSEKILKARFGQLYKSSLLITDPNNIFKANKSLSSIYPTIYFFKESKLLTVSEFSPNKNGLNDISKYILENGIKR
jgi:hypothetical protein